MALLTRPEMVSSFDSASVLILSCFLAFESKICRVLCRTPEPSPRRSPGEARMGTSATPKPVEARTMEVPPKMVAAAITLPSLNVVAVARRLNRLVSLSRKATSLLRNFSSSSIFLSL